MRRPLPKSPQEWLQEIQLAWKDAKDTKSFAALMGTRLIDKDLFQLAPFVCLKFRDRKLKGKEQEKVVKGALTTYVANADNLKSNPKVAFALCYVAAHFVLDLITEDEAQDIMAHCEDNLE